MVNESFEVIGTTAHNEKPIYKENLCRPLMIMIGNETMGLNNKFKQVSDVLCTIPMDKECTKFQSKDQVSNKQDTIKSKIEYRKTTQ